VSVPPAVRVLVLPEDTGKWTEEAWPALIKKLTRLIDPECATQRVGVGTVKGPVKDYLAGVDRWRRDEGKQRVIARTIANALLAGDVVVLHVDADVTWSERDTGANARAVDALRALVAREVPPPALDRLLVAFPHAAIESWLYLNRAAVEAVGDAAAIAWIAASRGPHGLDDAPSPKHRCPLGDRHNATLADRFPLAEAAETSPSLARWVAGARADEVRAKLAAAR
jgi:hypothetical protein